MSKKDTIKKRNEKKAQALKNKLAKHKTFEKIKSLRFEIIELERKIIKLKNIQNIQPSNPKTALKLNSLTNIHHDRMKILKAVLKQWKQNYYINPY